MRLWLSVSLLAMGAAMLAAAQLASAAFGQGGIFRYGSVGASVQIDPQVAYVSTAWWFEYATAAKLFNYPDLAGQGGTRLVPEVASRYTVSRDGKTWAFFIRKGFHFSDGLPVTAASFKYAIDRVANHDLASPAAPFITDVTGANIVGAVGVNSGRAQHVRGVVAKGNRLTVRLARPYSALPTLLAMPFFQATSARLPLGREVVAAYPSAGPYFFSRNDPNVLTQLRRNPYYSGRRPRNLRGLDVRWNVSETSAFRQVQAGTLDEGPLPVVNVRAVAKAYGVNRTRFWVQPTSCVDMLPLNSQRPLFRKNLPLRRALNWVVNRRALAAQAGPYARTPWTHLLPPTFPGSVTARKLQPYRGAPNVRKARRLAAGHLRKGPINIGYRSSIPSAAARARLVRAYLLMLGVASRRIKLKAYNGADLYDVMGKRYGDVDIGVGLGWCADYSAGSFSFLDLAFAPWSGIDSPRYRAKLSAAKRLNGSAKDRALGQLDVEVTSALAPQVVLGVYNNRYFFASRVDPRSLVYQNVYTDWSIPALALK
jgi:ABC-type oligopeptide transport system substrate-binding subunit